MKKNSKIVFGILGLIIVLYVLFSGSFNFQSIVGVFVNEQDYVLAGTSPPSTFINRSALPGENVVFRLCPGVTSHSSGNQVFNIMVDGVQVKQFEEQRRGTGGYFCGGECYTINCFNVELSKQDLTNAGLQANYWHVLRVTGDVAVGNVNPEREVYFEPSECNDPSFVTYAVSFRNGDVVTPQLIASRTGLQPVFCGQLPVREFSNVEGTVLREQSTQPLKFLTQADMTVTVPVGELWLFEFVAPPISNAVFQCEEQGGVYNAESNVCELLPSYVYICQGVQTLDNICITQLRVNVEGCNQPNQVLKQLPFSNKVDCEFNKGTWADEPEGYSDFCAVCETTFKVEFLAECPVNTEFVEVINDTLICRSPVELICDGNLLPDGRCVKEVPAESNIDFSKPSGIAILILLVVVVVLAVLVIKRKKKGGK